MDSKKTLYDLLKVSFDAGVNAGIIEAGHEMNMLKENHRQTFSEFMDIESVKFLFETLCNKLGDESKERK